MKKISALFLTLIISASLTPALAASAADFTDVAASDWYFSAVDYAAQNGLFFGTSDTTFSPNERMTRAMFVSVLGRYAGVSAEGGGDRAVIDDTINLRSGPGTDYSVVTVLYPGDTVTVTGEESGWYAVTFGSRTGYIRNDLITVTSGPFGDVPSGSWYAPYVNWAYTNGIVAGTGANTFSPDNSITREQMCAILNNFVQSRALTLTPVQAEAVFADDGSIAAGFRSAVYTMQSAGIISGRGGNLFCPRETASRAEVASLLMRFIENLALAPKPNYSYAGTVAESAAVGDEYFDDACFIGHSMVVGMNSYFNLLNADYYAVNGISASRMLEYDAFPLPSGGSGTVFNALTETVYGKVYIMLGINEAGSESSHAQSFYNSLSQLVSRVRELQPTARVYLISITPVSRELSDSSGRFTLSNIVTFNELIQQISRETGAGYLDFFTLFADSEGYMPPEGVASDGLHPVQPQYAVMKNYLKTHTF